MLNFWLLTTRIIAGSASFDDATLAQWKAIVSHDAATGYLPSKYDFVTLFAKTQRGTWPQQLDCGARVFDMRIGPITKNGSLIFHHGPLAIHTLFEDALKDTLTWARNNDGNLIVLYMAEALGHVPFEDSEEVPKLEFQRRKLYETPAYDSKTVALFRKIIGQYDVPFLQGCTSLHQMTVGEARKLAAKSNGVFAIDSSCMNENFDPSVHCAHLSALHPYCCFKSGLSSTPFQHLWNDLEHATQKMPSSLGFAQAHWQYDYPSMAASFGGSVLKDNAYSGVNRKVVERVKNGDWEHLSWIELNDVCDAGAELYEALKKRVQSVDAREENTSIVALSVVV